MRHSWPNTAAASFLNNKNEREMLIMEYKPIDPLIPGVVGKTCAILRERGNYNSADPGCFFLVVIRQLEATDEGKLMATCVPKSGHGEFQVNISKLFEVPTPKEIKDATKAAAEEKQKNDWKREIKRDSTFARRKSKFLAEIKKMTAQQLEQCSIEFTAKFVPSEPTKIIRDNDLDNAIDIVANILWPKVSN
jgi:hypothetical protein